MTSTSRPVSLWPGVYIIALVYFALHLATSTRYGYFRDALYYLACSEHLAFGYVDQPPLIAWLGWVARHTLGTLLPALLFWPALAGAGRIVLTAAFARELGAGRFGTVLAAALAATPGVWWVIDHQFAMNCFEPLLWGGLAYAVLRLIKTQNPKLWLVFGAIAGVGLLNKYSIVVFVTALIVGVLLTRQRTVLFTPWILAGGAIAFLIFLPNLIWNVQHDWPFLELMRNVRATGKDVVLPPGKYLLQQVLMMNPVSFPFWFGGLLFLLFARDARVYRALGWTFVIALACFMITHGKDYYAAPAYVVVLAAGGVAAERLFARLARTSVSSTRTSVASADTSVSLARRRLQTVLMAASLVWLVLGVGPLLPLVLPVLPIETFIRYQSHLPFEVPKTEQSFVGESLPQYYADEFPWPGMVEAVARVYHSLTPEEQQRTAIFANNYGQAAAVDFFGPKYGLPKAISGHQNYYLWGPRNYTGDIVIVLGDEESDAREHFESVTVAATLNNPYAYRYENLPVLLCRGLKWNLQTEWSRVKNWR
ncbi:MAG: glycosyltransferase family 39 protein [Acidobacteria bacterium]|nr:glycosyltransferase family 39 protein [Acidobacteriota bacterium]